ncbi:uncharacterized protein LOC8070131 [Sorghum bicolor]|jgi:hypothetical protein|uniref:Uncharacterized protein n=1 Tax=Sorghum bicolor TaxID=4558 RepID=C5YRJ0_SORBI|nr:uncharacterized protein LOC8070131 [Sorghum bicolor]EES17360.1 hypothetical protein SORBI_3008G163000 [Sorghum bicolor]|eukprot:XP_002443522.1 uncharacterized protein LOC8070131 [Sorghum bicolor]
MNRFRNVVLRKCKSLSRVAGRPSASSYSYSSLRSMSTRDAAAEVVDDDDTSVRGGGGGGLVAVFVGSSRRRYVISAEHLSHPLIAALIDDDDGRRHKDQPIAVNCEVVLFDHLLWMLDNAVDLHDDGDDDAMRELAQLYAC